MKTGKGSGRQGGQNHLPDSGYWSLACHLVVFRSSDKWLTLERLPLTTDLVTAKAFGYLLLRVACFDSSTP